MSNKVNNCLHCKKETKNPKYCSRSCAVLINNGKTPKRKLIKKCKICEILIQKSNTYCKLCHNNYVLIDYTLREVIYTKHGNPSAYSLVRSRARNILKETNCKLCGYDKHTEVCHIKPISSFSLDTKLSIINAPSNLIRLCPNCHWEYDNKMVDSARLELATPSLEG